MIFLLLQLQFAVSYSVSRLNDLVDLLLSHEDFLWLVEIAS